MTTVATFARAVANGEINAAAPGSPPTDSRKPNPSESTNEVKETQHLQMDNQNLAIVTRKLNRKNDLCNMTHSFCTNCILAANDQHPRESLHNKCRREKLAENEIHDKISTLSTQTIETDGLMDTNNDQTVKRMK